MVQKMKAAGIKQQSQKYVQSGPKKWYPFQFCDRFCKCTPIL